MARSTKPDPQDESGKGLPGAADPARALERKIRLSRLALFWERLWPATWPAVGVGGLFLLVSLIGLWRMLPQWAHMAGLALFLVAFGAALAPLARLRWPTRNEARARLDRDAPQAHRPATAYEDTLSGAAGGTTGSLWRAHRSRMARAVAALRVRIPAPRLMARDPWALRGALLVALVAAFAYAGGDWRGRLADAATPVTGGPGDPLRLDAWITPPGYTGRAPVFLADGSAPAASLVKPQAPIEVPAGSELVLKFHGDATAALRIEPGLSHAPAIAPETEPDFAYTGDAEAGEFRTTIGADTTLVVDRPEGEALAWQLEVLPDKAPEIDFVSDVQTTPDQALTFDFSAKDDYGVVDAEARFVLTDDEAKPAEHPAPVDIDEAASADAAPQLNVEPPDFALTLPSLRTRDATRTAFRDLTSHPWAGLDVELTLVARDEAGQEGQSGAKRFRLPERLFRHPLARAVIEQRRNLVRRPDRRSDVTLALEALTVAPDQFFEDDEFGVYLGLRMAALRSARLETNEDLVELVDLMWDIALRIEDGDLSLAERELRAAQEALARALAEDAPDEEIERLMSELRQALNRFLQALAEQARQNAQNMPPMEVPEGALQSQDLDRMMEMIERLARSGARDAAQQLLSQLQQLLESIQGAQMGQMSPQQNMMSEMLDALGRMIGEQQQLMDRTFRQGQQGQQGMQPGMGDLADQQGALRQRLQELLDRLGQNGLPAPNPLGRAGEAMGEATGDLQQGDAPGAVGDQREALDQLRQGANSLAQQLAEGMQDLGPGQGEVGRTGQNEQTDPLGRPLRHTGPDFGLSVRVPDEIDAERARELREELQRRLGDRLRLPLELDYIERLLERF